MNLKVDLDTPEVLKQSFKKLNTGTIFEKIIVSEEMLGEKMKNVCSKSGLRLPSSQGYIFEGVFSSF